MVKVKCQKKDLLKFQFQIINFHLSKDKIQTKVIVSLTTQIKQLTFLYKT